MVLHSGRPVDFVGAGWAYPLGIDATGGISLVNGDREIAQAIQLILGTAPGERPMRPEFGCRAHEHVFAPVNAATAGAIAQDVRAALEQWEPRIDVLDVLVRLDASDIEKAVRARRERGEDPDGAVKAPPQTDLGILLIEISYSIRGFNDRRNLVFPFYVIPDEDAGSAGTANKPLAGRRG